MSVLMTLRVALKALGRNKMRTALTMLGMIIGVAAVITMVALGRADTTLELAIGFIGVFLGAGNAVGGYVVTKRMLEIFKSSKEKNS